MKAHGPKACGDQLRERVGCDKLVSLRVRRTTLFKADAATPMSDGASPDPAFTRAPNVDWIH